MLEIQSLIRPPSPQQAFKHRRIRLTCVPLVDLRVAKATEDDEAECSSRHSLTGTITLDTGKSHFYSKDGACLFFGCPCVRRENVTECCKMPKPGICPISESTDSLKSAPASIRIKRLTNVYDGTSRFPKLDECAHFHYELVELVQLQVSLVTLDKQPASGLDNVSLSEEAQENNYRSSINNELRLNQSVYSILVSSNTKAWTIRRTYDNFRLFDKQLHKCIYDRKFSMLKELPPSDSLEAMSSEMVKKMLSEYLSRFSCIAGNLINCGPVLNWLELDNRGNRLIVTDDSAINTPAVAAAHVIKRYTAQASDELSFEVGDMISVIDMPPPEESIWWRGKKGFEVGFFPCDCVELIGDKLPQSVASNIPPPTKPVLRKHGKLISFFRSFITSRPSRRKLKQTGILKERVFGCDLGEHLLNSGREVPLVLKCCAETIEKHGIVDGIYRLSGITSNIQKLRCEFDEEKIPDLTEECYLQDIHCVASLLKMYFRELPNPLLTYQLYDKFVAAVQSEDDSRLMNVHDVVQQLPPPHYRTLECLIRHLAKVAAHGNETGMHSKNLAIVWAPNLLRSKELEAGGVAALHGVGVQAIVTEYLIRYADLIFNDKMPSFGPVTAHDPTTPKHIRPKSLAISTPTKLLSLEEARMRALTNAPPQKYIEVGGGPANLPSKYHTVIDVPDRKKSRSIKERKSPVSGWKSFFTISKSRSHGSKEKLKFRKNSAQGEISLRDFPLTESEVSAARRLRPVKSAESLVSSGNNSSRSSGAIDAIAHLYSEVNTALIQSQESSSRHERSVSHDSYFDAHSVTAATNMSPIPDSSEEVMIPTESYHISGSDAGTLDSMETMHSPDEDLDMTRLIPGTCDRMISSVEEKTENNDQLTHGERPRNDHKRKNSWALKEKFMQAFTSPPSPRKSESDASIQSQQDHIHHGRSTPRLSTSIKEKIYNAFSPESLRKKMRTPSPKEFARKEFIKNHKSLKNASKKISSDSKTSAKNKSIFRKSSEPQIERRRRNTSLRRSVSNIETTTFTSSGGSEISKTIKITKVGPPVMYETSFTWSECPKKDYSNHRRSVSLDQIYQADSFSDMVEDEISKDGSNQLVEVEVHATQSPRQTMIEVDNSENLKLLHYINGKNNETSLKMTTDEHLSHDQSKNSSRESPTSVDVNISENEHLSFDSSDNFESEQATTPISLSEQLSELETSRVNTSCSFRESDSVLLLSPQTPPDMDSTEEMLTESHLNKEAILQKSPLITSASIKDDKSWEIPSIPFLNQTSLGTAKIIDDSEILYLDDISAEIEEQNAYSTSQKPDKIIQQFSSTSEDSPVFSEGLKSKQIDELSTTTSDDSPIHSSETPSGQSMEEDLSDGELIKKDLAKPDIDRALRTLKDERIMTEMDEPDIDKVSEVLEPKFEQNNEEEDEDDGRVVFKMVMIIPDEPDVEKMLKNFEEESIDCEYNLDCYDIGQQEEDSYDDETQFAYEEMREINVDEKDFPDHSQSKTKEENIQDCSYEGEETKKSDSKRGDWCDSSHSDDNESQVVYNNTNLLERNEKQCLTDNVKVKSTIMDSVKDEDKDVSNEEETVTWTVSLPPKCSSEITKERLTHTFVEVKSDNVMENSIHSLMEQSTDSERLMSESSDDRLLTDSQTMEQSIESDAICISESSDEKMLTDFSEHMSTPEDLLSRESPLHLGMRDNESKSNIIDSSFSDDHEINANIMNQQDDNMEECVFDDDESYPGKEWGVVLRPRLNSQSEICKDDSFKRKNVAGTFLQTRKASVKELLSRFENQLGQKVPHDKPAQRHSFEKHRPPRLKPTSPTTSECPDTPPTLSPRTFESELNKPFEQFEEEQPFRVTLRRTQSHEPKEQREEPPLSPFKVELRRTLTRNLSEQSEAKEYIDDQPVFKVELRKTNRDLIEQSTKEITLPPTKLEKYESSPVFSPRTSLVRMSLQSEKFSLSSPGLLPNQNLEQDLDSFIGIKQQKERTRNSISEASLFTQDKSWHGEKGTDISLATINSKPFQKPNYLNTKEENIVTRRSNLLVSNDCQRPRSSPPVFQTYNASPIFSPKKVGNSNDCDGSSVEHSGNSSPRSPLSHTAIWLGKKITISDENSEWSGFSARQHGNLSDGRNDESSNNIPQYLSSV